LLKFSPHFEFLPDPNGSMAHSKTQPKVTQIYDFNKGCQILLLTYVSLVSQRFGRFRGKKRCPLCRLRYRLS